MNQDINDKVLGDLKIYGNCAVCKHCDRSKHPSTNYCKFGGCSGGGKGKIKEDLWEYRYNLNTQ